MNFIMQNPVSMPVDIGSVVLAPNAGLFFDLPFLVVARRNSFDFSQLSQKFELETRFVLEFLANSNNIIVFFGKVGTNTYKQ